MSNIILIGFMGVGKGTVARAYAKEYDEFAIDSDDLIESLENRKIKSIFEDDGEKYFRSLERKCALWLESSVKNSIISTGGGFYRQENLKKIGKVVLLDSSFDGIYARLKNHPNSKKKFEKRPLFKSLDDARALYNTRVKEYKKVADIVLDVENKDIKQIIKELRDAVKR